MRGRNSKLFRFVVSRSSRSSSRACAGRGGLQIFFVACGGGEARWLRSGLFAKLSKNAAGPPTQPCCAASDCLCHGTLQELTCEPAPLADAGTKMLQRRWLRKRVLHPCVRADGRHTFLLRALGPTERRGEGLHVHLRGRRCRVLPPQVPRAPARAQRDLCRLSLSATGQVEQAADGGLESAVASPRNT